MALPGDINGDGTVDLQDFGMVSKNWGLTLSPNPAPPPSAPPCATQWKAAAR